MHLFRQSLHLETQFQQCTYLPLHPICMTKPHMRGSRCALQGLAITTCCPWESNSDLDAPKMSARSWCFQIELIDRASRKHSSFWVQYLEVVEQTLLFAH